MARPPTLCNRPFLVLRAHLEIFNLVPDLLPSFNPSALMTVTFPGVGPISPGQNLSMQQVAMAPGVTTTPTGSLTGRLHRYVDA